MSPTHNHLRVDCYARSATLLEPVETNIQQLREYDERLIDELTITGWPDKIPLDSHDRFESIRAQYERFETWADDHSVSLSPSFRKREQKRRTSDTTVTVLSVPVLCLAITVNGSLTSVVPHHTETGTYTVEDALEDIEKRDRAGFPFPEKRADDQTETTTQSLKSTSSTETSEEQKIRPDSSNRSQ